MDKFPSAKEIIEEAKRKNPIAGINQLHADTFQLMMKYKNIYYRGKVKNFLSRSSIINIPEEIKLKVEEELLKPMKGGDINYSNFMEEASRRISQTFQPISGNIAELCVEEDFKKIGLEEKINYLKKAEHTDFIVYYPKYLKFLKKHRIEVKNVSLRERATRGLTFDGDSMVGFFNDSSEFTSENIDIIDNQCRKTGGYCYVPPVLLEQIENQVRNKRFKSNTELLSDVVKFIKTGII